jgi:hypothetical protein
VQDCAIDNAKGTQLLQDEFPKLDDNAIFRIAIMGIGIPLILSYRVGVERDYVMNQERR